MAEVVRSSTTDPAPTAPGQAGGGDNAALEQMETEERDGFVSQRRSWLAEPCVDTKFGQLRRAEAFIAAQCFVIFLLFIIAISAGASGGGAPSMCIETFSIKEPSITTDGYYKLPTLPYAFNALEPHLDEPTMRLHYYTHFNGYRTKLNGATTDTNLTNVQITAYSSSDAVRNNGGGYYNHGLFFLTLSPAGSSGQPSQLLQAAIDRDFGSIQMLLEAFEENAAARFGSGWVWLCVSAAGGLNLVTTGNQDNPLMTTTRSVGGTLIPFLGLDVWEHSYYLKYQAARKQYVAEWFQVIDWKQTSRYYEDFALQGRAVEWF
eukprot:Tamp_24955.p1 GENE.Tamp_24955~~Tamp_24955.p1  ORF type:complete len:319 (+),score=57.41 Tamp_24955:1-957(+)